MGVSFYLPALFRMPSPTRVGSRSLAGLPGGVSGSQPARGPVPPAAGPGRAPGACTPARLGSCETARYLALGVVLAGLLTQVTDSEPGRDSAALGSRDCPISWCDDQKVCTDCRRCAGGRLRPTLP